MYYLCAGYLLTAYWQETMLVYARCIQDRGFHLFNLNFADAAISIDLEHTFILYKSNLHQSYLKDVLTTALTLLHLVLIITL